MSRVWEVRVWRDPNTGFLDRIALGGEWEWTARPQTRFGPIGEWGSGHARSKEKAQRKADKWIASIESSYEVTTRGSDV